MLQGLRADAAAKVIPVPQAANWEGRWLRSTLYRMPKKHDCERGQNYRDRMASPNTGFDGYRKEDRDAPFPEQGMVFRNWRGPVGEWRVRL